MSDRALIARVAAHTRWAKERDPRAATAPARRGLEEKWAREVDPDGVMPPDELAKRVEHLRQAHMQRMALASAKARRERAKAA
jgi:hypothetical protein